MKDCGMKGRRSCAGGGMRLPGSVLVGRGGIGFMRGCLPRTGVMDGGEVVGSGGWLVIAGLLSV